VCVCVFGVCMRINKRVCMYVQLCKGMYECIYMYVYKHMYIMYIRVYVYICGAYLCTECIPVCVYNCIHVSSCVGMRVAILRTRSCDPNR